MLHKCAKWCKASSGSYLAYSVCSRWWKCHWRSKHAGPTRWPNVVAQSSGPTWVAQYGGPWVAQCGGQMWWPNAQPGGLTWVAQCTTVLKKHRCARTSWHGSFQTKAAHFFARKGGSLAARGGRGSRSSMVHSPRAGSICWNSRFAAWITWSSSLWRRLFPTRMCWGTWWWVGWSRLTCQRQTK